MDPNARGGDLAHNSQQRRWSRLLDGEHVWGSLDGSVNSDGFRSYRLVVFPPGISRAERRYLRMWWGWPTWGAMSWLALVVGSAAVLSTWTALAISTMAYLGAGALVRALAGNRRSQVRTLRAVRVRGHVDDPCAVNYSLLEAIASLLALADGARDQGRLSVIDHELVWWHVYDCLGRTHSGSVGRRSPGG
jgi:hypothetical protein